MEIVPLAELLGASAGVIVAFVTGVWLLSLWLKDSGIMDVFWGLGFIVVSITLVFVASLYLASDTPGSRAVLIQVLVAVWGVRLALHIGIRNHGKPEDYRYAAWRAEGETTWWWRSYFKVFLLQGLVMWIVALPIVAIVRASGPDLWTPLDVVGVAIWLFGFLFEAVGDEQLRRFKSNSSNKGSVMKSGLWRYTRHPNYFGEAVLWWGIWIVACSTPMGWLSVIGPILMTWLLLRVSGVAMLERGLSADRPEYADYQRRTNAFIPGKPRE